MSSISERLQGINKKENRALNDLQLKIKKIYFKKIDNGVVAFLRDLEKWKIKIQELAGKLKQEQRDEMAMRFAQGKTPLIAGCFLDLVTPQMNQKIFEYLKENADVNTNLKMIEHYSGIDYNQIMEFIVDKQCHLYQFKWLPYMKGLDNKWAYQLLEKNHCSAVVDNLKSFENLTIREVYDYLLKEHNNLGILVAIDKFIDFIKNPKKIAIDAIKEGFVGPIIPHKSDFFGFDDNELALILIEHKQYEALAKNLSYFQGLSRDIAQTLIEKYDIHDVFMNQGSFVDFDENMKEEMEEYAESIYGDEDDYYDDLYNYPENMSETNKFQSDEEEVLYHLENLNFETIFDDIDQWEESAALTLFNKLSKNGDSILESLAISQNWSTAVYLLKCLKKLKIKFDKKLAKFIKAEFEKVKDENYDRELYKNINLYQLMQEFYINDSILADVENSKKLTSRAVDHDAKDANVVPSRNEYSRFADNVFYADFKTNNKLFTKNLAEFLKQYLIIAVNSELGHQRQLPTRHEDVIFPNKYSDIPQFIKKGTPEEIRLYLYRANLRFNEYGWMSSYGGKLWGLIAQLAESLWSIDYNETKAITMIIDRIFQIQHNTGHIFDKDRSKIKMDNSIISAILDTKFIASDTNDMLDRLKKIFPEDADKNDLYKQKKNDYDRLMNAPVRLVGMGE